MKICLVCSHGGHLTQTLELLRAFNENEIYFATYHSSREAEVLAIAPAYFTENIGTQITRMIKAIFWAYRNLRKEHPDIIVSLGAEIAIPFICLGKLFGIKTIYIESWSRVNTLSKTGRLVYPVADVFWVQWPQMLEICGSKAEYKGAVI
jgi:UDP-N-acetylglucosamine:LPS N-acetylglucosamine transferase